MRTLAVTGADVPLLASAPIRPRGRHSTVAIRATTNCSNRLHPHYVVYAVIVTLAIPGATQLLPIPDHAWVHFVWGVCMESSAL